MSDAAFSESISLLRTRRFGTFWFASLLSNIGTWAQQVAQPWLLLSLGGSSFLIGLDAFALSAPVWLLTLKGGAFGVGGLLGAIGLLFVDVNYDRRYLSAWFAGAYGIVLVLAALNPWFRGLPTLLVVGGVAMSVSNISANTLLQANTTSQLRGQTVSLYMLAMRGGLSVGSLLTGLSASLLGLRRHGRDGITRQDPDPTGRADGRFRVKACDGTRQRFHQ